MSILTQKEKIPIIWKILKSNIIFILIVILIIISYLIISNNKVKVTLYSCIDGDTAWFIVNNKKEKVRLLGIDTPESTNYIEEFGIDASNYTCNTLKEANDIYLEYDPNSDKYDKYNRILGYIFVDNTSLNELLLSQGLAEVKYIYKEYKYIDNLCNSQYKAYKNKLGVWKIYDYNNNYCYKRK